MRMIRRRIRVLEYPPRECPVPQAPASEKMRKKRSKGICIASIFVEHQVNSGEHARRLHVSVMHGLLGGRIDLAGFFTRFDNLTAACRGRVAPGGAALPGCGASGFDGLLINGCLLRRAFVGDFNGFGAIRCIKIGADFVGQAFGPLVDSAAAHHLHFRAAVHFAEIIDQLAHRGDAAG